MTGNPCGPVRGSRGPSTDSPARGRTVCPTVATVTRPAVAPTAVSSPRRVSPRPSTVDSGRASADRTTGSFTARCTSSAPTASQPIQWCAAVKKNGIGAYQRASLSTPLTTWNSTDATRTATLARSTAWPRSRAGGQVNSRGYTDQSLAASSGTAASPVATCTPCVTRYRLTGRDGHRNHDGGCWMPWLRMPVRKQIPIAAPNHSPRWLVSTGERSGDRNAPGRSGPRRSEPGGSGNGRFSSATTVRTTGPPPSTIPRPATRPARPVGRARPRPRTPTGTAR